MKNNYGEILTKLRKNEELIDELDDNAKNCLTFAREAVKINPLFYGKFSEKVKKDEKVIQNIIGLTNGEIFVDTIDFQELIKNATNEEQLKELKKLSRLHNYMKVILSAKLLDLDERKVRYQNIPESIIELIDKEKSGRYEQIGVDAIDMYYGLTDGIANTSVPDIMKKLDISFKDRMVLINTIRSFYGCVRRAIDDINVNDFLIIYKNESDDFFTIKESNFKEVENDENFYNEQITSVNSIESLLKLFYDYRTGKINSDNKYINDRLMNVNSGLLYNFIINSISNKKLKEQIVEYFRFSSRGRNKFASEDYTDLDRERCNVTFGYDEHFWRLRKMEKHVKPFCKLYIPLSADNYNENVLRLSKMVNGVQKKYYEFVGEAKFRHEISNDNGVFRFGNLDAYNAFMELLMENQDIVKKSKMKPNMFIPNISKVGIIPDNGGSYNGACAEILSHYVNFCIVNNLIPEINGLLEYINNLENGKILFDSDNRYINDLMRADKNFKIKMFKILKQKINNIPDEEIIEEAFDGKIKTYKI